MLGLGGRNWLGRRRRGWVGWMRGGGGEWKGILVAGEVMWGGGEGMKVVLKGKDG